MRLEISPDSDQSFKFGFRRRHDTDAHDANGQTFSTHCDSITLAVGIRNI